MKNIIFILTILLFGLTTTTAQVKRLGLGFGYALPSGDIADITAGGLAAHFEVGYAVTRSIDVSLFYSGEFLAGGSRDIGAGTTVDYRAVAIGSYMLNGRYYFAEDGFRPYASLGLGLSSIGAVEIEVQGGGVEGADTSESVSNFAFRPALGFKYGVLNMNVAYLSAGKTGEGEAEASVSDITINLGLLFSIGGN